MATRYLFSLAIDIENEQKLIRKTGADDLGDAIFLALDAPLDYDCEIISTHLTAPVPEVIQAVDEGRMAVSDRGHA